MRLCIMFAGFVLVAAAADKPGYKEVSAALKGSGARAALVAATGDDLLKKGTAVVAEGPDFLFAVDSEGKPQIIVDEGAPAEMQKVDGVWIYQTKLQTGRTHNFSYLVSGAAFGGRTDVPAFGPDSYDKPGVPRGTLSEKVVHTSKIYPGLVSDYWVWTPAQYDSSKPAPVMVWQDGQGMTSREGTRSQIVFENLTHEKRIPVMVHVFIAPGKVGEKAMRSVEYDTVTDTYARFLLEEILPEVSKKYNLRKDGYSRAIAGNSSGGICAFNAAWFKPNEFSRVLSRIGSFTSIQWHPGELDGGNVYPFKIRKEPKRNIRTWLQDGSGDLENNHGSWPMTNIAMANSLKLMGYDFHFSFGTGTHNGGSGNSELPAEMVWLWRDYDPARTEQAFEIDAGEKGKPMFRVKAMNRD